MTNTNRTCQKVTRGDPHRKDRVLVGRGGADEVQPDDVAGLAVSRAQETPRLARRDTLVLEHLGLVKVIALSVHQKIPGHVQLDDLVQAGVVGLCDAANKFDEGRQDVFSIYAKHRIRGAILDSLRALDWATRDTRRKQKRVETAKQSLASTLDRDPTEGEVANRLGIDMNQWHAMMLELAALGPVSSTGPSDQYEDLPALDFPSALDTHPDFMCVQRELRRTLGSAINTLSERYQKVVRLYYEMDLSMREIGGILGVNESRVSQIHKSALEKLGVALLANGIASVQAFHN